MSLSAFSFPHQVPAWLFRQDRDILPTLLSLALCRQFLSARTLQQPAGTSSVQLSPNQATPQACQAYRPCWARGAYQAFLACLVTSQGACWVAYQVACWACWVACWVACWAACWAACWVACWGACWGACWAACPAAWWTPCRAAYPVACLVPCQVACQAGCQVTCLRASLASYRACPAVHAALSACQGPQDPPGPGTCPWAYLQDLSLRRVASAHRACPARQA
mmetsp:Transcript_120629/g.336610  ORF Transcript_120629/g.336610 Transcript_120629/m.336610 type:complete len:223 (-) Transcript_120629:188-856(-)